MLGKIMMGVGLMLPLEAFAGALFQNADEVDWLGIGVMVPAPQERCVERNDQPPCYRFEQAPTVGRVELVRIRTKTNFQWNLVSGFGGMDWTGEERLGMGILGLGRYKTLGADGRREIGLMVQPLAGIYGPTHAFIDVNVYHRNYFKHAFVEIGMEFAAIWNLAMSSESSSRNPMPFNKMPVQLHVSVGPRF